MSATVQQSPFSTANPHALAVILEASETKRIIASSDIFDIAGIKLWARDRPVSAELQRKLQDRQLRDPLETCLMAEDGVTPATLADALQALLAEDSPLARLVRPHAAVIAAHVPQLPLHSVAQLLLTASQGSRPESFDHSVKAMALCGALMAAHGGGAAEMRSALLCGLLHDLGEMYIDPAFGEADADRALDFESYQQLVVHPHIGHLLVAQLTNYPKSIARAIAEHHERLDGSGYPRGLKRDEVSPLGRMLALAEATLAVLRSDTPQLARVSVALRVVPGEFDMGWIGSIASLARLEDEVPAQRDVQSLATRLVKLDDALTEAHDSVEVLATSAESDALKGALHLADGLLDRLRTGWYASGLWSTEAVRPEDAAEVEAVEDELIHRLCAIERAAWLQAGMLSAGDTHRLNLLGQSLRSVGQ
ncbi:HD-GYP domain-containing protein [Ideonella sp. A 288]|uniref:HD-GYP domain-containing protein n=1 Tax=Ideonella sp. A 288 TaxID=1962181 RepID=UPI000B4BE168|nr:HD domain-containing phosphohydrolase [Ideonella sp. A 288]